MEPLFNPNQRLSHFVPISQNQGRITGNDFSAKAVLVPLHRGFDWLAAGSETAGAGLANPPNPVFVSNNFSARGMRYLSGPSVANGAGTARSGSTGQNHCAEPLERFAC